MIDVLDAAAVVAELRAEVARRRAAGDYDEELLRKLHEEFSVEAEEVPEALAYIGTVRPLTSTRPVLGPWVVFSKRVLRRLIAWYVRPIAEDETRFNTAAVRSIRSLERRVEAHLQDNHTYLALRQLVTNLEAKLVTDVETSIEFMRHQSRRLEQLESMVLSLTDGHAGESVAAEARERPSGRGPRGDSAAQSLQLASPQVAVIAFVLEALADLPAGHILVDDENRSPIPLFLAVSGHRVTAIDGSLTVSHPHIVSAAVADPAIRGADAAVVIRVDDESQRLPGDRRELLMTSVRAGGVLLVAEKRGLEEVQPEDLDGTRVRWASSIEGARWDISDDQPSAGVEAVRLLRGAIRS